MTTNDQLTDDGPSVTPEFPTGIAGPPFDAAPGSTAVSGVYSREIRRNALLVAIAHETDVLAAEPTGALYRTVYQMPSDGPMVGRPMRELIKVDHIQFDFHRLSEDLAVNYGNATIVLNGSFQINVEIPPQRSKGRNLYIPGIQDSLHSLLE